MWVNARLYGFDDLSSCKSELHMFTDIYVVALISVLFRWCAPISNNLRGGKEVPNESC